MRIGLDAIAAVGRSGNARYSRELIRALLAEDSEDIFYLFSFLHELRKQSIFAESTMKNWKQFYPYVSKPYYPFSNIEKVNESLLKISASVHRPDVFHFTNPQNFVAGSYKSVVTVHDLAPLHGDTGNWVKENSYKQFPGLMQKITDSADAIIAVSEYTKKDVVEMLGIAPERITVVYEGADGSFYPEPAAEYLAGVLGTYDICDYVLYTGQLQPRKNLLTLIRSWAKYKNTGSTSRSRNQKLVLAGGARDEQYRLAVEECIRQEGVSDSVILTGSVDGDTLRKLYSNARCFIYPSLFEGFGLPVLEALQCGTPVITSRTTSLPEVAGDAGILIDPYDTDDIANALQTMIEDDVAHRIFKEKALLQAAHFNWNTAALETLAVYTN